ncbi:MAG TPA: transglycosylase SLT domain-containing protein [Clostridiales bacterium]|nr:transglycosylase SLT domain-containing protein [Clostridiales bacterium]HQP69055.1 transglycosylase SLT domain-containing protein [Clostridiales bacterium]
MKKYLLSMLMLMFCFSLTSQESELEKYKKSQKEDIDQWKQERDAELDAYKERVEKERKEWQEYVNSVRKKWGEFSDTTPKVWSNYGNDLNSLGKVDFDNNKVEIAALIETDDPKKAEELMEKQLEILLNEKEQGTNKNFMENQIAFEKMSAENEKKYQEKQKEFEDIRKNIERKAAEEKKTLEEKRMSELKKMELEKKALDEKLKNEKLIDEQEKKAKEEQKALEIKKHEIEKKLNEEKAKIEKAESEKKKELREKQEKEEQKYIKTVSVSNTDELIKEKIKKDIKKEVVVGEDGKARTKFSVTLDMVPNSVQKRAENYLDMVKTYSEKNELDPSLVLALIHTESAFNPKAFSRRPDGTPMACGLMQIIPSQAGRDAHKALYGKDKIVESDYLFDPDNNLKMGTWYLKNLSKWWVNYENKNFKRTSSPEKNEYLAISSYNQGMGTILNKSYKANKLIEKSDEETYAILTTDKNIPKEGRDYLQRVADRKKLYKKD